MRATTAGWGRWALAAALAAVLVPAGARAQEAGWEATPLLPAEHWAVRAAARAEALGLVEGYLPAQRSVRRAAVHGALARAAFRAADGRDPALAALTEGWLRRFAEEFREYADSAVSPGPVRLGSAAGVEAERHEGRLAPGIQRLPGAPLPDREEAALRAEVAVALGRHLSLAAQPRAGTDEAELARWDVTLAFRGVALSVGRESVGYGDGRGGGVVLSASQPLPRVELETTRPGRLPSVLRHVGPVSLHTFLTRLDEARHAGDPWMWGARVAFQPHARFTFGVNRAAMFGGDSAAEVTVENVAKMLVGVLSEDFENQLFSLDLRWRLPTEGALPATVYVEWGAEDGAGALNEQPGVVAGVFLPGLPGVPGLALGVEHARLERCCGHGVWYFHSDFIGNWVRGDVPLGHPIAGGGRETLGYLEADLFASRLRVHAGAFARSRAALGPPGRPGNLFAPERAGESWGARLQAWLRLHPRAEARAALFHEDGDGWREQRLHAGLNLFF
ncbi:MAG TPA: capsule assembly Wzi family protein [Longimicrobiaceae bacterium]|nr:capsule assembly Wzi family protein [Longimicrobiaceae bacterium]